jgi:hypothetical protein
MKITKRQLKRIIKEEKIKLLQEQGVEEGVSRGVYESVWNFIEEHSIELHLDLTDPIIANSVADGLQTIASEIQSNARKRVP